MTPQTCKKLLEMGILQAYAEGKKIDYRLTSGTWVTLEGNVNFDREANNYRIKPEPQFEVGDLVQVTGTKTVYRITKFKDNIIYGTAVDSRMPNHFYAWDLTKVKEVYTPFTFEQAVKACAEHGMVLSNGSCTFTILYLDNECLGLRCLETAEASRLQYKDTIHSLTFLDNTPFYNISYEPIPSH